MRIRPPSRLHRIARWIGLLSCLIVTLGWASTMWGNFGYQGDTWSCTLTTGAIEYESLEGTPGDVRQYGRFYQQGFNAYIGDGCLKPGYRWRLALKLQWPRSAQWEVVDREDLSDLPEYQDTVNLDTVFLPLWVPFAVVAVPTAYLWWPRIRRRLMRHHSPGHCRHCGYNLTGNESGKCPECATPVPKQEATT